jgi:hypothetical protein
VASLTFPSNMHHLAAFSLPISLAHSSMTQQKEVCVCL